MVLAFKITLKECKMCHLSNFMPFFTLENPHKVKSHKTGTVAIKANLTFKKSIIKNKYFNYWFIHSLQIILISKQKLGQVGNISSCLEFSYHKWNETKLIY